MGKVVFDTSMSLDGFMAASNVSPEEPMGEDGERLHDWALGSDPVGSEVLARGVGSIGAVICGRRTYDLSLPWWGADGPTGAARLPVIVVSHSGDDASPEGGVYAFFDGIEGGLARAREVAGGKDVTVMGGASIGQQFLRAGLVDELSIHLVPVLLGDGIRVFEGLGPGHVDLQTVEVLEGSAATHLRFRVAGR